MQRNGSLLFEGNTARTGGAMSVLGSLEMAYGETVNFNGNQADGGSQVYGGALYVSGQGALADLHHITELKFTGNKAAMGGALASIGEGRLRIHDNGSVLFEKNQIYTTPGDIANGSALYSFNDGSIEVSDNGSVTFKENDGSAIYVEGASLAVQSGKGTRKLLINQQERNTNVKRRISTRKILGHPDLDFQGHS